MGCTASKHPSKQDGMNAPLSRSISVQTQRSGESVNVASWWKSRTYSLPKSDALGNNLRNVAGISGKQRGDALQTKMPLKLTPVKEEGSYLEHEEQTPTAGIFEARNHKLLKRSATYQDADKELRLSTGRKGFAEASFGRERPGFMDPSESSLSPFRSFSCKQVVDRTTGLGLLLSPLATPCRSFTSPTRGASLNKSLSSNGSFDFRCDQFSGFPKTLDILSKPPLGGDTPSMPEWITSAGNSVEPNSPLFDPSILATFEKALEALSDDSWQSSGVCTSSSESTSFSSETCSDADSPDTPTASGVNVSNQAARKEALWKGAGNCFQNKGTSCLKKKPSFSKVSPLDHNEREWISKDFLENFERRCPPGCESKIVLYFTSLRAIRKTFEDCCTLRLILQGFRIHVDERDIWMHSKFRDELTDAMGVALTVPRLFVKGRYIGGAEEVKQLHEEGLLGKLFEGLPTEWKKVCDICGGARFLPCTTCNGSCKMILRDQQKSRCPDCNENGLIMCPSCDC